MKPFLPICCLLLLAVNVYFASKLSLASASIKSAQTQIATLTEGITQIKLNQASHLSLADLELMAKNRGYLPPTSILQLDRPGSLAFYAP